jgi:hypothetical protein
MNARLNDLDWEPDPYEGRWAAGEAPERPEASAAMTKKVLSVTHDLTDDELRRFVEFDTYYDPMPMLGFIPQWVLIAMFFGTFGAVAGLMSGQSRVAMVVGGLILPLVFLKMLEGVAAERRRHARAIGLCEGRIVTITPRGLSVEIPGASETSVIAIGRQRRSWKEFRKISTNEVDLTFWMRPVFPDLEGRARVVIPLRAFADRTEAAAFETAARRWHAVANGADTHWWDEPDV